MKNIFQGAALTVALTVAATVDWDDKSPSEVSSEVKAQRWLETKGCKDTRPSPTNYCPEEKLAVPALGQ
ncbi:MAG: hypothetical protein CBB87_03950 [Micavibrio sp. TMED27]|nr:hypothetical protein [Micavibrio sp.]OUT91974.1 MAG: hypothetical protein CBB87_03950 [Micavibrio sp. TMED27]|tara:strand:- start:3032 stop:3238 length:207 start_codon:yes stop_codon:yes gene_type:complete